MSATAFNLSGCKQIEFIHGANIEWNTRNFSYTIQKDYNQVLFVVQAGTNSDYLPSELVVKNGSPTLVYSGVYPKTGTQVINRYRYALYKNVKRGTTFTTRTVYVVDGASRTGFAMLCGF